MSRWALRGAAAAAFLVWASCAQSCPLPATASPAEVQRALRSGLDLWGNRLLHAAGGPTLTAARRFLPPLRFARARGGAALTASGVYYLPFSDGPGVTALHVADGSRIYSGSTDGPSLGIAVGGRPFDACRPRLAGGWLPILAAQMGSYAEESFAARIPGTHATASFVRVAGPGPLRFTPSASGLHRSGNALVLGGKAYALFSAGARFDGRTLVYRHGPAVVAWLLRPARIRPFDPASEYADARAGLETYWRGRLDSGAQIEVPEPYVEHALHALLVQNLELTWRYSIGNAYEEFSFPESVDGATVLAEYGFASVARSMLRTSFTRSPSPYPQWKMGERLLASALYGRLFPDDAYVAQATPVLRRYVGELERALGSNGLLARERYSSDIPDSVYGLHSQAVVWQGLQEIAAVWARDGHASLAARARALGSRLGAGVRRAVRSSETRLPDRSLFVPVRLSDRERPYESVVESRAGSYWNLVAPYAFASGLLDHAQSEGALRYLLRHGSRLLGLVRAGGYALYGRSAPFPTSGTDEVYGVNVARFLAAMDEPDQLVLSLYGHLAAGMTPDTFVSGEAASVAPLHGERERSMYLPPNSGSNDALLETLRVMLVQERGDGLRLAYATPRAWLRPGRRIGVANLPTSFGPLSYSLQVQRGSVHVTVDVPTVRLPASLRLRLRLPGQTRTIDLSGRRGRVEFVVRIA